MSTRQILGAVGAVVGAYFGNPQLGYAIGSAIGGAVDPEVIKGPSIGDIVEQTSMEGGPRPFFYGLSKPIAGNVIEQGPPRIVKKKQRQGKGGPKVETESVYRTYAVGVGETCGGFVRVWRNGQLVYDVLQGLVSAEDNARFLEHARFFLGTFDQLPSPDLEALFGVGTTPAHRGTAYMVMADEDLTDLRGAIPQWTFQVQRCGVSQAAVLAISNGTTNGTHQVLRSTDGENFVGVETPTNVNSPAAGFQWTGMVHSPSMGIVVACDFGGAFMISEDAGATWELLGLVIPGESGWQAVAWSEALGLFAAVRSHSTHAIATSADGRTWTLRSTPAFSGRCIIANGSRFIAGGVGGAQRAMISDNGTVWTTPALGSNVYELAAKGSLIVGVDRGDTSIRTSNDNGTTWAVGGSFFPWGLGDIAYKVDPDDLGGLVVSHFGAAFASDLLDFDVLSSPGGEEWEGVCHSATFGGFYLSSDAGSGTHNRIGKLPDGFTDGVILIAVDPSVAQANYDKMIAIDAAQAGVCTISVAEIVTDICARAGLPSSLIDVTELEDLICNGLTVTNQYPAFAACRSLSEVFFFEPADIDGKVHFIRRGGNSVATITEDDFLEDEQDIEQSRRSDPISIPRVMHLNYHDVAGGIAPDKQSSERAGDRRATGEMSLQSAVLMTADQAARVVAINHKVLIEDQRGELKFELSDEFIALTPTDTIVVQWQGRSVRARLAKVATDDGSQEYLGFHDRQSAYTSAVEGIPAAPQTPPPSSAVGPTLIQPLDIHILQDADDNVGLSYYVAVSGILEAWQGAQIELSYDAGANYIDSATTRTSAIMGELITELPDHPQAYPDEVNEFRVRIDTPLGELEAASFEALLSRDTNLAIVGDELIQFATPDEAYEGIWDVAFLLRGRKGSQTAHHAIGERFVLLDRATLNFVNASLSDIGRTLTFRATSYGTPVETGTVVSMVYTGRSQIEREPAYLMAHRDGSDAVVSWQGVGRLGAGTSVAHGARFTGYRVTFDDGVLEEVIETTAEELTHDVSAFGAPLTIRVAQLNALTGAGPEIEVVLT